MSLLECMDIWKNFGGVIALKNVNLSVKKGEILGIIGPNGAGKTTLFNVISGYYRPDQGKVIFDGEDITGQKPYYLCKKGIARTFQIPKPFKNLTVFQNVLIGKIFGKSYSGSLIQAKQEIRKLLDIVGLSKKENYLAAKLNVVDLKLLELARALATDPRMLLIDEVLAGLNPAEISATLGIISEIRNKGITILMIEHIMRAIMNISDRIIVLHKGEVLKEGSPKEVATDMKVIEAYLGEKFKISGA